MDVGVLLNSHIQMNACLYFYSLAIYLQACRYLYAIITSNCRPVRISLATKIVLNITNGIFKKHVYLPTLC